MFGDLNDCAVKRTWDAEHGLRQKDDGVEQPKKYFPFNDSSITFGKGDQSIIPESHNYATAVPYAASGLTNRDMTPVTRCLLGPYLIQWLSTAYSNSPLCAPMS